MVAYGWPRIPFIPSIYEEGSQTKLRHGYQRHEEEEEWVILDGLRRLSHSQERRLQFTKGKGKA